LKTGTSDAWVLFHSRELQPITGSSIEKVNVSWSSPHWIGGTVADPGEAVLDACGQSSLMPHCQHTGSERERSSYNESSEISRWILGKFAEISPTAELDRELIDRLFDRSKDGVPLRG
jgi:hypothetical protein